MIPYELIARYLAGECNEEEKQLIQEWSREYPDIMDEYIRLWKQIPTEGFAPDVEQALQQVNKRIDTKKQTRSRRLYIFAASAAAVLLLLISIVGIQYWDSSKDISTEPLLALVTNADETLEYQLPDGSKVWLNHSSVIRCPEAFTGNTREIQLEGEAFFDISPDADKPFIIHANNTVTRVVGTSFGIKAFKDVSEVVVTVSTGIINFSAKGEAEHIELTQGEQGICVPTQKILEKNTHPDPNSLAWKTKLLIFKQTSLTEVASVLENTYHVPVKVDHSVADMKLTSTFDQRTLDDIIQIIEKTLQIRVEESGGNILLTSK